MVDSLKFGERSDRLDRANPEPSSPACRKEGVETVRATPWLLGRGEETVQTTNMSQDMAVKTEVVRILGPEVRILSRTPDKLPASRTVSVRPVFAGPAMLFFCDDCLRQGAGVVLRLAMLNPQKRAETSR